MSGPKNGTGGAKGASPKRSDSTDSASASYEVTVSVRFLLLSLASCVLLAFTVGRAARFILIEGFHNAVMAPHDQSSMRLRPDYHEGMAAFVANPPHVKKSMPPPIVLDGKEVPKTIYTSKNFDTASSITSSNLLIERPAETIKGPSSDKQGGFEACPAAEDGTKACSRGKPKLPEVVPKSPEEEDEEDEEHLPAGQHLLIDIKDVDGDFLNSEERLAQAMIDIVTESRLTLLSYHCHSLVPNGVTCVGVLLESHVSFHTWPDDGVILLDLFTCGSDPLVPLLPALERLFGVPRIDASEDEQPNMIWSHKLRGFRNNKSKHPLGSDLGSEVFDLMIFDLKEPTVTEQTKYQRIDIVETIEPRFQSLSDYKKSLSDDGSYQSLHKELYLPERRIFLDGVLQSTRLGDESYHESLVHPAMFAHPNPERVVIIGGGEGATLREVLKHNTVKKAVMVEIDEEMVNLSHKHITSWSDCSDLNGSADWCIEDRRADVYYEDAVAWFMDRFSGDAAADVKEGDADDKLDNLDPFDVIIMDALDPQDDVPFAKVLYNSDQLVRALYEGMTHNGVIIMQLGASPYEMDPADASTNSKNRALVTELLEQAGFQSIHVYEEGHSKFKTPWSYLVAFKQYQSRALWFSNPAAVEVKIHERIKRTYSGKPALKYFDGATMSGYTVPPKAFEDVFCRKNPVPEECLEVRGFDPKYANARVESFEVKMSTVGERSGRGVFATVDIPANTRIAQEQSVHFVGFPPDTCDTLQSMYEKVGAAATLKSMYEYMHGYGFMSRLMGDEEVYVDSSILTFVNHGCNGTYNMGSEKSGWTEWTVDPLKVPPGSLSGETNSVYNPVIDRHLYQLMSGSDFTLHDIKKGEEILDNYLAFTGSEADWTSDVNDLRAQCSGEVVGSVTSYEEGK